MKKTKIKGFLQSTVLVLLFLALLGQCAFYIAVSGHGGGSGTLQTFPDSELMHLAGDSGTSSAAYRITPYFVAVLGKDDKGGGSCLALDGDGAGSEVWQYFTEILSSSAKGTAKQVTFADSDEKAAYLSGLYENAGGCYYARFSKGIEFSVLTSLVSGYYDLLPENPDFVITDMFLLGGSNGEASLTALDDFGNVLKIFPSRNVAFNNELIETYNDTGENAFVFMNIGKNEELGYNGYFPVLLRSLPAKALVRSELSSFFATGADSSDTAELLSVFGMNIDNTRSYSTADGDSVFVEDTSRLRVTNEGTVEYFPAAGGTPISALIEYAADGFRALSLFADSTAQKLNEKLALCDGKMTLYDISYSESICTFVYRYTANGIPVSEPDENGEPKDALRLVFSGGRLISAKAHLIPYRFSGETRTAIPQRAALAVFEEDMRDGQPSTVSYFGAQYVFAAHEKNSELVWSMKTQKEAEH